MELLAAVLNYSAWVCRDRALRDPDYDSHLGLQRDPETREIVTVAQHT